MEPTTYIVICLAILIAIVLTVSFNFMFTEHKSDVNTGLFVVQVISFTIITLMTYFWPEQKPIPDYEINLEQDGIHITNNTGGYFISNEDTMTIDEFIIQDNL